MAQGDYSLTCKGLPSSKCIPAPLTIPFSGTLFFFTYVYAPFIVYASMVRKFLIPAITLSLIWLLLSGYYTRPLLLSLGAISAIGVTLLSLKFRILDPKKGDLAFHFRVLLYLPWLFKEIVKSNLDVAFRIWRRGMPVQPQVVFVKASQNRDLALALHANSITLTPGTLSIDTGAGYIEVHALSEDFAQQVLEGEFDRRICALEGNA
ncbi:MAG: multicomponent Na+:H+ antiporter subunit E [Candidatus Omnitrophota bacterium]|jgi:multicomponent Na+:H+ antiporter subunit E